MEQYELSLHQADRFLYHMGHDEGDVASFDRVSVLEDATAELFVEDGSFGTYELRVEGETEQSSEVVFSGEIPGNYEIGDELEV